MAVNLCDQSSSSLWIQAEEIANEVADLRYDLVCSKCSLRFSNQELCDAHECIRKRRGPYKNTTMCRQCFKRFTTPLKFRLHFSMCHPIVGKVSFGCKLCPKVYPKHYLFKAHYDEHMGVAHHHCAKCGRGFATSSKLYYHMRFQHDQFLHECNVCGCKFATLQMLGNHTRTDHTKERTLQCGECQKTFSNSSCLYQHRKTHRGIKAFECPLCDMKFSRKFTMSRHVRRVHCNADKETIENSLLNEYFSD